jgi:cytochrome P450
VPATESPSETVVLSSVSDITAALLDERLVPPPAFTSGSTMALRAEMARFSGPADHTPRRVEVEAAVGSIDLAIVTGLASRDAAVRLERAREHDGRVELITTIGRPVAVATIARIFGTAHDELDDVVNDVDSMAATIGRGDPPSTRSDDAVDRLSARFAAHPLGRVAVVSSLYQSMDATAALVATRLIAREVDGASPVPVARTTRIAPTAVHIAGTSIAAGTRIDLEIGATGLWFGAGVHACPGRALAETIANAIVDAIDASGATLDIDSIELDVDRRPAAVWLDLGVSD